MQILCSYIYSKLSENLFIALLKDFIALMKDFIVFK